MLDFDEVIEAFTFLPSRCDPKYSHFDVSFILIFVVFVPPFSQIYCGGLFDCEDDLPTSSQQD